MYQPSKMLSQRCLLLSTCIKTKLRSQRISSSQPLKAGQKVNEPFVLRPNFGQKDDGRKITPLGWALLLIPATTFGLGCWQVKRKLWKENLIKELEEKTHAEPVDLPDNLDELHKMEYRMVKVRGQFLHDKEMYLGPRSFVRPDGVEVGGGLFSHRDSTPGYLVVTPFKLSGREEIILINRGWISRKFLKPETRQQGQITGDIELTGVVRLGEVRPQFTPEHKGDVYLYRDLPRMCAETGASPFFIDANYSSSIHLGPIGGQTRVTLRNEHMSYIVTWFGLSAATCMLWYRQIIKRKAF